MKANSLRSRILLILSILLLLTFTCGALSFGGTKVNASADLENAVSSFKMLDKQQLRTEDPVGMRFAATMSVEEYTALTGENSAYTAVDFGFFIMPKYYEKVGVINYDNTFGSAAVFTWEGKVGTTSVAKPYEILHADGVQAVLGKVEENGEDLYLVKGSLAEIFDQNLATKFTARMYVKATKADNSVVYAFADQMTTASSMVDVAIRGIEQGDSALQSYVDKYVAYYKAANEGAEPTYSYTVNYYVDGTATPVKSEVVSGNAINTPVSITATAPDGYILDSANASKNVLSGKVYADNDLTLSVYVKADVKIDGNLFNKELYHFGKDIADANYNIDLPVALGEVTPTVKIAGITVNASYVNDTKTLTITAADVANITCGDTTMTIETPAALYTAKVTIADVIVNTESELYAAFEYMAGVTANHCTDYIILGNDIICETVYTRTVTTAYRLGTFDGKGYAIANLNVTKPFTSSLQSVSIFKNVVFINATNQSTSGFFGADSGSYEFDNVAIIFNENKGGGLVNYSAANITFTNSLIVDLTAKISTDTGFISRTYNSARTGTFTNSFVVSDKTPFQGGTDTTSTIYQDALAMVIATDATVWFKSLNGTMPEYLGEGWSFDQGGNLCYNDIIVIRNVKDLVGEKNNGELFYFSKDVTAPTGYAAAYVEDGYYKVTMPSTFTETAISSISIANKEITGFTFANGVLKVPVTEISQITSGDCSMHISNGISDYQAKVTIADIVLKTEADVLLLQTFSSGLAVLDGDITWTGACGEYERAAHLYGTLDGKGYALKDMVLGKDGGSSMGGLFNTFQGGLVKNFAMIDVSFGPEVLLGGVLAGEVNGFNVDNVFISVKGYVGPSGLLFNFAGGGSNVNNTIIVYNGLTADKSAGAISSAYATAIGLSVNNTFAITGGGRMLGAENAANTNVNYSAINELACADIAALLTKSENLKNFDSNYWSIKNGSIYFGDEVVVAAPVAE